MLHKKNQLILVVIIFIATALRFNQLNSLPALNADEAAIAYNAYSLIETGKDEHGHSWPIHFESFGDWKPGLFFYIVLPFVKVLGLNEWAVRIPGATLGVLTVLLIYLLGRELFPKQSKFSIFNFQFSISEIAALFLAISPWHIHFSRGGWEVNASTFFIVLGTWLFLKWINSQNNKWLFISIIALVASLYTYHATRIIVPFLGLGILFFYRSQILKNLRIVLLSSLLGIILLSPLAKDLLGPARSARVGGVSIFADPGVIERINEQRGEHDNLSGIAPIAIHNKVINYTVEFLENWGEHFWGEFLFFGGDEIERNKVPEMGQLYLFQLPLLVIGLLAVARNSMRWGIVLWWLIIAPVAAALTFQSPHALRAHNMVIPLTIISAYGMLWILGWLGKIRNKSFLVTCYLLLVTFLVWDFSRYLHQYYVHMAKEYPFSSQYGVKELVTYVQDSYDKYQQFIITDRYDQPYILFLFYLRVYDQTSSAYIQYPPVKFQIDHQLTARDKFGFSTVRGFDKFQFKEITSNVLEEARGALVAGADREIEDAANIIRIINFPNGEPAFKIVAN